MIQCEECRDWFHAAFVKVSYLESTRIEVSVVCIGASYRSNVNSLTEPVSDYMPYHKNVEKYTGI